MLSVLTKHLAGASKAFPLAERPSSTITSDRCGQIPQEYLRNDKPSLWMRMQEILKNKDLHQP
jgi:hypothetical protein